MGGSINWADELDLNGVNLKKRRCFPFALWVNESKQ